MAVGLELVNSLIASRFEHTEVFIQYCTGWDRLLFTGCLKWHLWLEVKWGSNLMSGENLKGFGCKRVQERNPDYLCVLEQHWDIVCSWSNSLQKYIPLVFSLEPALLCKLSHREPWTTMIVWSYCIILWTGVQEEMWIQVPPYCSQTPSCPHQDGSLPDAE